MQLKQWQYWVKKDGSEAVAVDDGSEGFPGGENKLNSDCTLG